jgi:hypothetical protein
MSDSTPYQEAQVIARLTVLERVVGMMVRDSMKKSGKGPQDILEFAETVKTFLTDRTPVGATDKELNEAADRFFSTIASDVGSRDSH